MLVGNSRSKRMAILAFRHQDGDEVGDGSLRTTWSGFQQRRHQVRHANEYGAPEGIPSFRNFGIASHPVPAHRYEACGRNPG
jgi:hypothetical protein